jgi:hypothetical protein
MDANYYNTLADQDIDAVIQTADAEVIAQRTARAHVRAL